LLSRYARVVDHLTVENVAQGAPLGGGNTLHPLYRELGGKNKNDGKLTLFFPYYYPL